MIVKVAISGRTPVNYGVNDFNQVTSIGSRSRLRIRKDYMWPSGSWYPEVQYLYDGMLLVQERNGANTPTVTYTRGRDLSGSYAGAGGIGGLLARSHGYSAGNWTYHNCYHADGNGNVTALVNSAGTLQASYKYDPYGRYLSQSGTLATANALRFSSKPWIGFNGSTTSGLYAYGYRFYDPYLQRWVNRDPIHEDGGINLYAHCEDDPINYVDTIGLELGYEYRCPGVMIPPVRGDGAFRAGVVIAVADVVGAAAILWEVAPVVAKNTKIDGPAARGGRILQLRYGSTPLLRLDFHPIPGSDGKPVLHVNIGPGDGGDSIHIPLWLPYM